MTDDPLSAAKRRVIEVLKRAGPQTAPELAERLSLSAEAVRQHLTALDALGLVEAVARPPEGRGRPAAAWSLTDAAHDVFPDRHADLTLDLIAAIRSAVGEEGLDRVIEARGVAQEAVYREAVGSGSVRTRADRLARMRSDEGYMAEVRRDGEDLLLVESHCPICDAAAVCTGICRSELDVFQAALGDEVDVSREQHLLAGDERCVYRIRSRR